MISAVNVGKVNADARKREVREVRLKRWQTDLYPVQRTSAADLFSETDLARPDLMRLSDTPTYDWQIFSSATRLRITRVAPFICINCFFLNSENSRLTVSRVVPITSATSS